MIELKLEIDGVAKEFNIPTNWEEVTVGQFEKLAKVEHNTNVIKYLSSVICALSGITEDEFFMIPADKFEDMMEVLEFVVKPIDTKIKDSIIIDDEEYFIKKDFNKMNMGEIISIETLTESAESIDTIISKMLCVFLRKKVDGKLEDFKNSFMEREELFKSVIITDVHNLFNFFLTGENL